MTTYQAKKNPFLDRRPYVYAIMWTEQNAAYVGVRHAKGCHPKDFWESYFTSSSYVREFRRLHGEPDHIEIIDTFLTAKEAVEAEYEIISTFSLHLSPAFLNMACGRQSVMTDEIRAKMSAAGMGRKRPPEVCAAISAGQKGKARPHKMKEGNHFYGKTHSAETRQKMSEAAKNRQPRKYTDEQRARMSLAQKAAAERRRQAKSE